MRKQHPCRSVSAARGVAFWVWGWRRKVFRLRPAAAEATACGVVPVAVVAEELQDIDFSRAVAVHFIEEAATCLSV